MFFFSFFLFVVVVADIGEDAHWLQVLTDGFRMTWQWVISADVIELGFEKCRSAYNKETHYTIQELWQMNSHFSAVTQGLLS